MIWDERLITRARAADMCGTWDLKMDYQQAGTYLRCNLCDGNVTRLPADGVQLNVDVIIAAVVRHMVMNHDYKLSGAGNEDKRIDATAADIAGDSSSGNRIADPVR